MTLVSIMVEMGGDCLDCPEPGSCPLCVPQGGASYIWAAGRALRSAVNPCSACNAHPCLVFTVPAWLSGSGQPSLPLACWQVFSSPCHAARALVCAGHCLAQRGGPHGEDLFPTLIGQHALYQGRAARPLGVQGAVVGAAVSLPYTGPLLKGACTRTMAHAGSRPGTACACSSRPHSPFPTLTEGCAAAGQCSRAGTRATGAAKACPSLAAACCCALSMVMPHGPGPICSGGAVCPRRVHPCPWFAACARVPVPCS